jgi:hypothetical protein
MTLRKYYMGGMGPYLYDDEVDVLDPDGDFPGCVQSGMLTDGPIKTTKTPTATGEVLRFNDIGTLVGNVVGPASATADAIAVFNSTTGKIIKNSTLILDSSGNLSKNVSDLEIDCGTEKTVKLVQVVYDDIQVGISGIRIPAANAPTERLYNHGIAGGVTFPVLGFEVDDYIYFDVQTSHSMKLNTILENHIHFMTPTDGSGTPSRFKFRLDVIAAGIGESWAVPSGSPFTSEHIIADDYSNEHHILNVADIPSANTTVSSIYSCKLTRVAATVNEYAAEVYIKYIDCHYQKDTIGSRQETVK